MAVPFEDPLKTEMRAKCEIAVDQAGHDAVDQLVTVDLPQSAGLQGRLKGDLQSLDAEGRRYIYYMRPGANETLPKWLANLATACHQVSDASLYVVVEDLHPSFELACKSAGAGLLLLTDDAQFDLRLDFDLTLPQAADEKFLKDVADARRNVEAKLDLNHNALQKKFETVSETTQGMDPDLADKYIKGVERQYRTWTEWAERLSNELDAVYATRDTAALEALVEDIDDGPTLEGDS